MDNFPYTDARDHEAQPEVYVSVDVETSGPHPSGYSLLSIGACVVGRLDGGFYVELKPVGEAAEQAALDVSGLSMAELAESGADPAEALVSFERWLEAEVPRGHRPVFVAFNAPFDWMFVNDYFFRFLGRNPFGHSALDVKAFYMGLAGVPWSRTSMRWLGPRYLGGRALSHNALADARDQAELFSKLLAELEARGQSHRGEGRT